MRTIKTIFRHFAPSQMREGWRRVAFMGFMSSIGLVTLASCEREPLLHLYDSAEAEFNLPMVNLDLQVYWDYEVGFDANYDWRSEWNYGWDETDRAIFGEIGYTEPKVFNLRRYYTGSIPRGPHTMVTPATIEGSSYQGRFEWGFWDLLVWNQVYTLDGIQSLHFDEASSLDSVVAYTNASMMSSRYQAPRFTHAFYEPEALFAAYDTAIEINRNLDGFVYVPERNMYVRMLDMTLLPVTYIYLTQVILRHNNGRVVAIDGNANLSGMARTTTLNTGVAGEDPITVYYRARMKTGLTIEHPVSGTVMGETADIVGGRLLSFGLCRQAANHISRAEEVTDNQRHYMDLTMQFSNGIDSMLVFDVTDQVRRRYKGGVITVVLDMDTIPTPIRQGGSAFDAVVKDIEDGGTYEFEM